MQDLILEAVLVCFVVCFALVGVYFYNLLQKKEKSFKELEIMSMQNQKILQDENLELKSSLALAVREKELVEGSFSSYKNEVLKNTNELKSDYELRLKALKSDYEKTLLSLEDKYTKNLEQAEQNYNQNLYKLEQKLEQNYKIQNELMLNQNTKALNESSLKTIKDVFEPIKEQMQKYEKTLNEQKGAFDTGFKLMVDVSQNIGKKADEFALTLKGEKKIRGNFGEIMLESVLSSSGLKKDEHFYLQKHFKTSTNETLIPDAVVYFDDDRCVVIDSKFSLGDDEEQIYTNLKSRIDELSKKDYPSHIDGAYEYAILFVPYKNILDMALEKDPKLHQYAYNKKIFLASANVLFMGLKSILMGWNHKKQNDSVVKIFDDFAKFYEKFAGIVEDFENIKKSHQKTLENIDKLDKKLISGRGNLSKQMEGLKSLGIKTKKALAVEYNDEE